MTQGLGELVEQFCLYQFKQRGRTKGGVEATRWVLNRFVKFVRAHTGRNARVTDLTVDMIQQWMDGMAAHDLSLSSLRTRQATLSSLCTWLVKRDILMSNPVAKMDRPPHRSEPPTQVPSSALMDALIDAARRRQRPGIWPSFSSCGIPACGGNPSPPCGSGISMRRGGCGVSWSKGAGHGTFHCHVRSWNFSGPTSSRCSSPQVSALDADTPLFWSTWGRRGTGKTRQPMTGKNIWRLCKVYGRMIGAPMLKPHDLRHGVAMEVYGQHHDLEQVRAVLGHARIDTTQMYARIRPPQLKQTVGFYEARANQLLSTMSTEDKPV